MNGYSNMVNSMPTRSRITLVEFHLCSSCKKELPQDFIPYQPVDKDYEYFNEFINFVKQLNKDNICYMCKRKES